MNNSSKFDRRWQRVGNSEKYVMGLLKKEYWLPCENSSEDVCNF
jgi:hypothetical protein